MSARPDGDVTVTFSHEQASMVAAACIAFAQAARADREPEIEGVCNSAFDTLLGAIGRSS